MEINQYVLDTVREHLLKRQVRSTLSHNYGLQRSCRYRGHSGLKCAIGALIDDEEYTTELECKPVHNREVLRALGRSLKKVGFSERDLSGLDDRLLEKLQHIHDKVRPDLWQKALDELDIKKNNAKTYF